MTDSKANVLLVDDHSENLLALEAILEQLGQNLVRAYSGQEALRCLLDQDFAVILLDVQMPGMDGFETASLIRQRVRSRNTPIIFLTAFSTNDSLMFKGYALGAVDYLTKPIDPVILTSKVSVFVELFNKSQEVNRQALQLSAMNAELRRSEERFRILSACSPIGIFLTDTDGRCSYTNPSCQAICGFKIEEDWEAGWAKFIHPEDHDRVLAEWAECTHEGQPYSDEFRIYGPDAVVRWVHVRTAPMLSDHYHLLGHVGTIEDISDRKQAELAREQIIQEQTARQQAEAANRMKDEFLAIVSHELRTPLNSILGWSRLLLSRNLDETTKVRALETIERNARSQAQLIEDILDVSQIIRGKLRLTLQPVNLVTLMESVIESVQPLASAKSLTLVPSLSPLTQMVSGDPERLRQIVWNLLSNAIKFTPEGGRIEVKLASYEAAQPLQSYAQIQVIDTGIGISANFLPYVFERFRQADSTTTRSYGGLGLGLAIVRYLVELHQGRIQADSEGEGKGATFTVHLPLTGENLPSGGEVTSKYLSEDGLGQPPSLERVNVLVVEDNPDAREFIAMVLQRSGAEVWAVGSVSEALEYLACHRPDVLVSDIGMPEQDGHCLVRQLRQNEPEPDRPIPAVALTAYTRSEDRSQVLDSGFQVHVAKPVEPEELVAVVARLVRRTPGSSSHRRRKPKQAVFVTPE